MCFFPLFYDQRHGDKNSGQFFSLVCGYIFFTVSAIPSCLCDTFPKFGDLISHPISKQKSLSPFVFLEAIRHIRHFFDWQSFQGNTLYPLAIIHMEHINVLDYDDKSERNLCFSFGNLGIIFNGASAQLFPPGRNGNSAGSEVTRRPMAAEINRCRLSATVYIGPGYPTPNA